MKLVLENSEGKAVRTFMVSGDSAVVISRKNTRRVELHTNTDALTANKVDFETLAQVSRQELEQKPVSIGSNGRLRLVNSVGEVIRNQKTQEDDSTPQWFKTLGIVAIIFLLLFTGLHFAKVDEAKLAEQQKQQIVQIVKRIPVVQQKMQPPATKEQKQELTKTTKTVKPTKTASVKRMGALAVFGSMNQGKQRGGVNLGAVSTSAGPGLGGSQGSGGVQTSLYGKGLVAAPLGAGSNMQGGGGYGTKGKGGGQAGYGKLSLVGSAGTSTIPLGREALVEGGLDRDLIADVINRHMGQFRFCYEQGLQGTPGLAGRIAVRFVIGAQGQVRSAGIDNSTMNSSMVESCVVNRMKSLKFPLPEGGVDVKVSYPFMFRRTGQG